MTVIRRQGTLPFSQLTMLGKLGWLVAVTLNLIEKLRKVVQLEEREQHHMGEPGGQEARRRGVALEIL